jgi:hypothetical protein
LGGAARYVGNEEALVYMRESSLPQAALDKLAGGATRVFRCDEDWMRRLNELGLTDLTVAPDPVRMASEGALWGAICEERRLGDRVIVSDGVGQFRVGAHARSAGSTPNGWSTSWSPPTRFSTGPSRSRGG